LEHSGANAVSALVREAFAQAEYPGDWCLRGSNEGDEPYFVEQEFRGKDDWQSLAPDFLDQAPDGYASALSFLSDEAFRFYLPAYLIADLEGRLQRADPVFYLCFGLDDGSQGERVNPRRFGERTWSDECRHKFAIFTRAEAAAIAAYLHFRWECEELPEARDRIAQALRNYWTPRSATVPNPRA